MQYVNMLHLIGCGVSRLFLKCDQSACVHWCVCVRSCLFFYFSSGYEAYASASSHCWNESALFSSDAIRTYCSFNSALLQRCAEKCRPITLCHSVIFEEKIRLIYCDCEKFWNCIDLLSHASRVLTWSIKFLFFFFLFLGCFS